MIGANPCVALPVMNLVTHSVDPECSADQFQRLSGPQGNGKQIAIHDLLSGMALLCQGQVEAKVRFVFALFDFTHSNALSRGELCMLFASAMRGLCAMKDAPYPPVEGLERLTAKAFGKYALLGQEAMRRGVWKNAGATGVGGGEELPLGLTNGAEGDLPLRAFVDLCRDDPAISALLSNLDTSVEATEAFLERMLARQKVLLGELAEVDAALESAGENIFGGDESRGVSVGEASLDRLLDSLTAAGGGAAPLDSVGTQMKAAKSRRALGGEAVRASSAVGQPLQLPCGDDEFCAASRAACEMCSSMADTLALPGFEGSSGCISFDDVALLCHVGGLSLAKDLAPAFPALAPRVAHSLRQECCVEGSRAKTRAAATLVDHAAVVLRQRHPGSENVEHDENDDCDNARLRGLVQCAVAANADALAAQKTLQCLAKNTPCTPALALPVRLRGKSTFCNCF